MIFTNFPIFRLWERIAGDWVVIESWSLCKNVWPSFVSNELKLDQEFSQNFMTSHSRAICSQSQKIVKLQKIMAQTSLNFDSTCYLTDVQCMIGKRGPTFWHHPRHSTVSESRTISSRRPKCANLARADANTYDTVANRPVKTFLVYIEIKDWKLRFIPDFALNWKLSRSKEYLEKIIV